MSSPDWVIPASIFLLLCLSAQHIGRYFISARLPLITGFLATGILVGPFGLELLTSASVAGLRFVDETALAFIGLAAGAELHYRELRSRLRSIRWITFGLVVTTFTAVVSVVLALADGIPFVAGLGSGGRLAVALLAGSVLIARSPSSAIAVVNELRARGPFTRTVLGVTVVMDVVVIVIFGLNTAISGALLHGSGVDTGVIALVVFEVLLSIAAGVGAGRLIPWLTQLPGPGAVRNLALLASGYAIFAAAEALRHGSARRFGTELFLEPLLICMVAGFTVANFSDRRAGFQRLLDETGPAVYVAFFTLAGASLDFDTLLGIWAVALALFVTRLAAVFLGSFLGGWAAGDPMRLNRLGGLSFITQAGVGLGLAKEVAIEFPPWGDAFATMMIAVIVLNQIVGPPLFKLALHLAGEAHVKAGKHDLRGTPMALIFGLEHDALGLARQLGRHGWQAKIVSQRRDQAQAVGRDAGGDGEHDEIEIAVVPDLSIEALKEAGADRARAFVALMSEDDNFTVCEAAYEHFGTRIVVARSTDPVHWPRLRAIGASIVDPGMALVSLLDQLVRSPAVGAMVLDAETDQDVIDLEVASPDLEGAALRDVSLPLDVLVLSIRRDGANLIAHGYTRLRRGDLVTVMGHHDSLERVALKFAA